MGLAAVLAALVLAPAGFTAEPVISARAAYVAGKPVSIYCASTDAAWNDELGALNDAPLAGFQIHGVTPTVGADVSFLAPDVCAIIHARLRRQIVNLYTLGGALDVVAVESLHLKGEANDGQVACDAIRILGRFAITRWGFRNHTYTLGHLLAGGRLYLAGQPPQYHAAGC